MKKILYEHTEDLHGFKDDDLMLVGAIYGGVHHYELVQLAKNGMWGFKRRNDGGDPAYSLNGWRFTRLDACNKALRTTSDRTDLYIFDSPVEMEVFMTGKIPEAVIPKRKPDL